MLFYDSYVGNIYIYIYIYKQDLVLKGWYAIKHNQTKPAMVNF